MDEIGLMNNPASFTKGDDWEKRPQAHRDQRRSSDMSSALKDLEGTRRGVTLQAAYSTKSCGWTLQSAIRGKALEAGRRE